MATSTIQCDPDTNDLVLVEGNLSIISGQDACSQNIGQRTKMRLGENQFNVNEGVDFFGTIFTPQSSYDNARASIVENILACPDTISVQSLTITIDGNEFEFVADVTTQYGTTTESTNG